METVYLCQKLHIGRSREDSSPVPLAPPLSLPGLSEVVVTSQEKPKLKNHTKCGITTGGQVSTSGGLSDEDEIGSLLFAFLIFPGGILVENPSQLVSDFTNSPTAPRSTLTLTVGLR